jgi:hypothetical protein
MWVRRARGENLLALQLQCLPRPHLRPVDLVLCLDGRSALRLLFLD